MYLKQLDKKETATGTLQAARGQIVDINGIPLNTNKIVYKVIVQKAFFPYGSENEILKDAIEIFIKNNEKWIDTMPITKTKPYKFTTTNDKVLDTFKTKLGVNLDATVDNCVTSLVEKYELEDYEPQMQRYISGVRYEMELKDFSYNNQYVFAEDVTLKTITELKELSFKLQGLDIIEEPMRVYLNSSLAPHLRGVVGAISAEKYEQLKPSGYTLNDTIGKGGIESALESTLRGKNGIRTITRDSSGNVVSDEVVQTVIPGNNVKLTIDSKFQNDMQTILQNQIKWLHDNNDPKRGNKCTAGSAVVLDVKTGGVLAMANYPSYDINEYLADYDKVMAEPYNPVYNRAISGLYRPGSTFKVITGAAGLINGFADSHTTSICTGKYTRYTDYQPVCTGYHYGYDITECIKWSCNIFFYELGRKMGIDVLDDFATKIGIGTDLGLEIGGETGRMTTPEGYEKLTGKAWTPGDMLQTSIGQSETLVTPLHLAVEAMAFANNGKRFKPYLVDSITSYDGKKLIEKTSPSVVQEIDEKNTNAFEIVREGMVKVPDNCLWPVYDSSKWIFDYLPSKVAMKTGTPQTTTDKFNSTVIGYYPAEDPQIAFGIVLEDGEFSRYMVRNIIDAYFYDCYEPDMDETGKIVSPWKRWTEEKTAIR